MNEVILISEKQVTFNAESLMASKLILNQSMKVRLFPPQPSVDATPCDNGLFKREDGSGETSDDEVIR